MFRKPCCTVLKDVKKVWNQTIRMLHPCYIPKRLGILGVPFHHGQTKPGVLKSPDIIREAGLTKELNEMCKNSKYSSNEISQCEFKLMVLIDF